ncbi:19167_t:CDS:2 [Dentiscutata erythropus]|uniref:19167_t:CDS:1 n=1 Tax=Dentiscutata erythropus TaxID=1348616 RepID=A0A9N9D0W7_9GLOM|nr:19167_t:CDS:2 [Dentiscutata erythropus]
MSKFIATISGFIVSGALLYYFQNEIENNTSQIRSKLHNTRNQLEDALPSQLKDSSNKLIHPSKRPNARPQLPIPSITQTQNYINHRFIPTFKTTWNDQVTNIANKLTGFDANESAKNVKSFIEDNSLSKLRGHHLDFSLM